MNKKHRLVQITRRVFSFSSGILLVVGLFVATASAGPVKKPGSAVPVALLPAKISLKAVPMILSPGIVPSEPSSITSKATLQGVDSNKNGVRDDVERWIAQKHPNCARYRAALAQMALSVQRRITAGDLTEEVASQMATEEASAAACLATELEEGCESASIADFIEFSMLHQNTLPRAKAYTKVAKALGKKAFAVQDHGCTIPPNQLPN